MDAGVGLVVVVAAAAGDVVGVVDVVDVADVVDVVERSMNLKQKPPPWYHLDWQ